MCGVFINKCVAAERKLHAGLGFKVTIACNMLRSGWGSALISWEPNYIQGVVFVKVNPWRGGDEM